MSGSVAMVLVTQVVKNVRDQVYVDEDRINHMVAKKKVTPEQARDKIITTVAKKALALTENNIQTATAALIIVDGRGARLPQCAKLLRKHKEETVAAAYELKDNLSSSNVSLRQLCELVMHTDEDEEGELVLLRILLEELAECCVSEEQQWHFQHRIREMLNEGLLLETISERILGELDSRGT